MRNYAPDPPIRSFLLPYNLLVIINGQARTRYLREVGKICHFQPFLGTKMVEKGTIMLVLTYYFVFPVSPDRMPKRARLLLQKWLFCPNFLEFPGFLRKFSSTLGVFSVMSSAINCTLSSHA